MPEDFRTRVAMNTCARAQHSLGNPIVARRSLQQHMPSTNVEHIGAGLWTTDVRELWLDLHKLPVHQIAPGTWRPSIPFGQVVSVAEGARHNKKHNSTTTATQTLAQEHTHTHAHSQITRIAMQSQALQAFLVVFVLLLLWLLVQLCRQRGVALVPRLPVSISVALALLAVEAASWLVGVGGGCGVKVPARRWMSQQRGPVCGDAGGVGGRFAGGGGVGTTQSCAVELELVDVWASAGAMKMSCCF